MGEEGFNKRLEVGVDVGRDAFSGGTIGGDDGTAGAARFVYLRIIHCKIQTYLKSRCSMRYERHNQCYWGGQYGLQTGHF